MIKFPDATRQFIQTNISDVLGNLYATFNADLVGNRGKLRVGRRMILNSNTSDLADLTSYPLGFRYFNNGSDSSYYTAAGLSNNGFVFKASAISGNFTKVTTSGAPSDLDSSTSDMETAFGELYVSSSNGGKVYYLNGSNTWANLSAGSAGFTTMLCYYPGLQRVYATKLGNQIQSWDSTHTVASSGANTLTLGIGEVITWIRASSDRLWIGTINMSGGKGYIYEWDGVSTQWQFAHRLQAAGALACVIKDDIPYIIDSNGVLSSYNGGTFKSLTGIYRRKLKILWDAFNKVNTRFIHPNGMAIVNGRINALMNLMNYDGSSHTGTQEDCNPSGIWEYDGEINLQNPAVGGTNSLYHKFSFASTKQNDTIIDYGQFMIYGVGAISEIVTAQSPITTNGTFLAGAVYFTDMASPTTSSGIFYDDNNDTLNKIGYLITTKMFAGASKQAIIDSWNKIFGVHEPFLNPDNPDKIVIKYRTSSDVPVEGNITWTSTTTFTTLLNVSAYGSNDEVLVLAGLGAGQPSHIVSVSAPVMGVYTVTVSEPYTSASNQVSYARFSHWIYIGSIKDVNDFDELLIGIPNSYIQLKAYMIWAGPNELSLIDVVNNQERDVTD